MLYHIPERDCGGWSAGAPTASRSGKGLGESVATAFKGHRDAMVILEPDALPQLGKCDQDDRLGALKFAVNKLSTTGARVYIDIGNEDWLSPDEAARRLKEVGVGRLRASASTSLPTTTPDPRCCTPGPVRSELAKLGIDDAHFVVDVGRAWRQARNLTTATRLGLVGDNHHGCTAVVRSMACCGSQPGETDGACRGGPDVGFWPPAALSLLGLAGS